MENRSNETCLSSAIWNNVERSQDNETATCIPCRQKGKPTTWARNYEPKGPGKGRTFKTSNIWRHLGNQHGIYKESNKYQPGIIPSNRMVGYREEKVACPYCQNLWDTNNLSSHIKGIGAFKRCESRMKQLDKSGYSVLFSEPPTFLDQKELFMKWVIQHTSNSTTDYQVFVWSNKAEGMQTNSIVYIGYTGNTTKRIIDQIKFEFPRSIYAGRTLYRFVALSNLSKETAECLKAACILLFDELPINANVSVVALKSCPLPFDKLQKAAYQILSEALAGAERTEHLIDTANKTKLTPTQLLTGQLSKSQEDLSKSQRKRKILGKALKKQGIDPKLLDSSFSSTTSRDTTPASTPKRGPRPCNLELSPLLAPIDESPACSSSNKTPVSAFGRLQFDFDAAKQSSSLPPRSTIRKKRRVIIESDED